MSGPGYCDDSIRLNGENKDTFILQNAIIFCVCALMAILVSGKCIILPSRYLTYWNWKLFYIQIIFHQNRFHVVDKTLKLSPFPWNTTISKPWWRHQMGTFSALLAICAGNSPVPGEFPTQRPVTRSFDVYIDLRPDTRLSNCKAGDLRRSHTHYDVIVMNHKYVGLRLGGSCLHIS